VHNIEVRAEHTYAVSVGAQWLDSLKEIRANHHKVLIIAPSFIVASADLEQICKEYSFALFVVPDSESQKEIEVVARIWELLGDQEFGRKDAVVAIGGGATTDLGGFVAATWLRGIAWYAIPTSLAGMVDASVGGKTGINTQAGKNLVGAFYSPQSVIVDLAWLSTLSDRDFSAGLSEVIKTGYIRDTSILDILESTSNVAEARDCSEELIVRSVRVKADVVSTDFKEGKLREILNYGHTFGHAIEKASEYSLRHGEAVAIGSHFAALLSEQLLNLSHPDVIGMVGLLKKFDLPTEVVQSQYSWEELLRTMSGDKKSRDGQIRFIGLRRRGEPAWLEGVEPRVLAEVYERIVK
jgi:3-dehydroquinate synthase